MLILVLSAFLVFSAAKNSKTKFLPRLDPKALLKDAIKKSDLEIRINGREKTFYLNLKERKISWETKNKVYCEQIDGIKVCKSRNFLRTPNYGMFDGKTENVIDYLENKMTIKYCVVNDYAQKMPFELKTALSYDGITPNYSRFLNKGESAEFPLGQISLTEKGAYKFVLIGFQLAQSMIKESPFPRIDISIPAIGITFTLYGLQIQQFNVPDVTFTLPEKMYDMETQTGTFPYAGLIDAALILGSDYQIKANSFLGKIFEDTGYIELNLQDFNLFIQGAIFTSGQYGYTALDNPPVEICPYHFSFGIAPGTLGEVKIGRLFVKFLASHNSLLTTIVSSIINIFKMFLESTMSSLLFESVLQMAGSSINSERPYHLHNYSLIGSDIRFPNIGVNKFAINVPASGHQFAQLATEKKYIYDRLYNLTPKEIDNFYMFYKSGEHIKVPSYQSVSDFSFLWNRNAINSSLYLAHNYFHLYSGLTIEECMKFNIGEGPCPPREKYTSGTNAVTRGYFESNLYSYNQDGSLIRNENFYKIFGNSSDFALMLNEISGFNLFELTSENGTKLSEVSYNFFIETPPFVKKIGPSGILTRGENLVITIAKNDRTTNGFIDYFRLKINIDLVQHGNWYCTVMGKPTTAQLAVKYGMVYFNFEPFQHEILEFSVFRRPGDANSAESIAITENQIKTLNVLLKYLTKFVMIPYLEYMEVPQRENDRVIHRIGNIFLGNTPLFDFSRDSYLFRYDPINDAVLIELDFENRDFL